MNEPKKQAVSKRKLTLNRETLRAIEVNDPRLLEGVAGGLQQTPTNDSVCAPCLSRDTLC